MQGMYRRKSTEDTYDTSEEALPFHLQRGAEEHLGETATRRKESLEKLVKLLSEEPDLHSRMDTEFLLRFLRVRKYNVEAALQTIRNYYYNRCGCGALYREFFPSTVAPGTRKLVMVLPGKDVYGRPILFVNIGAWSAKQVSHAAYLKASIMCTEHITSDPVAQTLGMVILMNCKNFAVESALAIKPALVKRGLEYAQDCMPSRMKAIHVVYQAHAFDIMYAFMKPFLKSKLARRVSAVENYHHAVYMNWAPFQFHGQNLESLHKEIPPVCLPADLGGSAPPLDYDGFWNEMDKLENRFEAENRYGYSNKYLGDFATEEELEKDLEFF